MKKNTLKIADPAIVVGRRQLGFEIFQAFKAEINEKNTNISRIGSNAILKLFSVYLC